MIAGHKSCISGIWEIKSRSSLVGKKLLQKHILTANTIMRFFSHFLIFHLLLYFNSASGHNSTSEVNNKLETLLLFCSFLLNCCIAFTGSDEREKMWSISLVSLIMIRWLSEEQMMQMYHGLSVLYLYSIWFVLRLIFLHEKCLQRVKAKIV